MCYRFDIRNAPFVDKKHESMASFMYLTESYPSCLSVDSWWGDRSFVIRPVFYWRRDGAVVMALDSRPKGRWFEAYLCHGETLNDTNLLTF